MTRVWKWNRPVTVREVLEDLQQERSIAYTTVMTVMDNLHQKGWVRREAEGRAYRYEAVSTRAAYSAALMNEAWSQSDNPAAALVAFFGMMSEEQREALQGRRAHRPGDAETRREPPPEARRKPRRREPGRRSEPPGDSVRSCQQSSPKSPQKPSPSAGPGPAMSRACAASSTRTSSDGILLDKATVTLYEDIQEFWVAERDDDAEVVGCGALHVMWEDLAEVRTLAVDPGLEGRRRRSPGAGEVAADRALARRSPGFLPDLRSRLLRASTASWRSVRRRSTAMSTASCCVPMTRASRSSSVSNE